MKADKPVVTVVHELPGRVRMRLSHPLENAEQLKGLVLNHQGVKAVDYDLLSRSVLVHFDPRHVTQEEIIIRVAFSLALDCGDAPVRILAEPEVHEMSNSGLYSGALLIFALTARLVRFDTRGSSPLDWIAGLGTVGAVIGRYVESISTSVL